MNYQCTIAGCLCVCVFVCVCVRACVHVCEAHSWHFILLYVNTYFVYYLLFIYFYYPSWDKPGPLFNLRLLRSDRRILWVNRSPPFSQFAHHASVTSHTPMKGFTLKKMLSGYNTHGLSGIIWHLSCRIFVMWMFDILLESVYFTIYMSCWTKWLILL